MKFKRVLSGLLALTTLSIGTISTAGSANAFEIETKDTPQASGAAIEQEASAYAGNPNDLCSNIEDGVILHAWCWSFKTIADNMKDIAEAGYTAVQTSPANACAGEEYCTTDASGNKVMKLMGNTDDKNKVNYNGDSYDGKLGAWWWQYQPTDWTIGNYQLGTKEDYEKMCAEADKYGVKIITDIVANHTTDIESEVKATINGKKITDYKEEFYHKNYNILMGSSRNQIVNYTMNRLWDINTENPEFQAYFLDYCNNLIAAGCDGFRYDTAKHIALPSDSKDRDQYENNFWPVATGLESVNGKSLNKSDDFFLYGEVLSDDTVPSSEYAKYMKITASRYGDILRDAVGKTDFSVGNIESWKTFASADRLVTWVESHDTYCNEHKSAVLTDEQIILAWAVIAARSGGTPLFFNRPANSSSSNFWGDNIVGNKGNDSFKDERVVAVNKFRNAMVGQPEELKNPVTDNTKILQINRGNLGTCIINLDSYSRTITVSTGLADGTYTDTVTGNSITVSGGNLTCTVEGGSIATIYKTTADMSASPSTAEFTTDSIDVTLASKSACTYTVTSGNVEYDNGSLAAGETKVIKIGDYTNFDVTDTSKKLALTLTSDNMSRTYTYVKRDPGDITYAYFDNSNYNWNNIFAYVSYNSNGINIENAAWPGAPMKYDSETGYYKYEIPYDLKNGNIIFFCTDNKNTGAKRYPADGSAPTLSLGGTTKIFSYNNKWSVYSDYSVDAPNEDHDLDTYNYVYFFNSMGWLTDSITAELRNSSNKRRYGSMQWSDTLHCYYYKYEISSDYNKVRFSGTALDPDNGNAEMSVQTEYVPLKTDSKDNRGKVFVPLNDSSATQITGEWISPNQIKEHTLYFENNANWTGTIRAYMWKFGEAQKNCAWPGESMKNLGKISSIDNGMYDIYKYTYYIPEICDSYNCIRFVVRDGSTKYNTSEINTEGNANYSPETNALTLYTNSSSNSSITPKSSEIPVTVKYYNHQNSTTVSSGSKQFTESLLTASTEATLNNKTLSLDTTNIIKMNNVYDDFTFYGSQFEYVSELASLDDNRIEKGVLYSAFINPDSFGNQNSAFSGVYDDSESFVDNLNPATKTNWITYYDASNNEVTFNEIKPDLSNVDHATVYAFSKPSTYNVSFCYPTAGSAVSTNITVKDNLVTGNYTAENYSCRYNRVINEAIENLNKMEVPQGMTFDGWYMLKFNNAQTEVESYLKVSSEKDYKFRITKNIQLYAVFRPENENVSEPTAAALADNVDIFQEGSAVKYRFNTVFNISNCADNDSNIKEVGVVYVKLQPSQTYNIDIVRNNLKTALTDASGNLSNQSVSVGSDAASFDYYRYTVGNGTGGTVKLTEKNRLQFVLTMNESHVQGNYFNVLAFTVFKYGNTLELSQNCVNYQNGVAYEQYLSK